jgi:DNA-binding response OmpR family regulator
MEVPYGRQILLVEDDRIVRQDVRQHFEKLGYTVLIAERGQKALEIVTRNLPDIAIVDIFLPDMSGFEVCRVLKRYADVPIIFLTHDLSEETKVMALEQYAEDYVTKPYGLRELGARVARVLRRFSGPAEESYAELIVDDYLRINFSQHWVEVAKPDPETGGEFTRYLLTPIESRIMHILIRNAGRVMTTESLLSRVWSGEDDAYPEGLRVHVRRLRMKIEPDPSDPKYIVTERGLGYRFAVAVRGQVMANATAE